MKKIIAIATALTVAAMVAGPGPAQGATIEELEATILELQEQLETALAQLAALGGGAGVGVSCTFTRNLYPGMSGTDVKCLQEYLNDAGHTLTASGAGSAGNETEYYGPLTQAAVGVWQDANDVAYGAYQGYFGPVSQAKYDALAAAGEEEEEEEEEEEDGAEGNLTVTLESTPSSGTDVDEGETATVVNYKLQATESDLVLERVDLKFDTRGWLYLDTVALYDGDTLIKEMDAVESNFTEVTVSTNYNLRFSSISVDVPEDTKKIISVKVTVVEELPNATDKDSIGITALANAFRAVDESGLNQYSSALDAKTFDAKTLSAATLELSANADNPADRAVMVSETAKTEDVVLLRADVKAKNNEVILRTVNVYDANADAASTTPIDTLFLYDSDDMDNALSSTSSITVATSTFSEVNLTIPKGETKTLVVVGTIAKTAGNYVSSGAESASSTITLTADTTGLSAEDTADFASVSSISGSDVTSGGAYFYVKAPSLALSSASIVKQLVSTGSAAYYSKAEAKIKIDVTANSGNIYLPTYAFSGGSAASSGLVAATNTVAGDVSTSYTYDSEAYEDLTNECWIVYSGDTKWFEVTAVLTNDVGVDVLVNALISSVKWGTSAATSNGAPENDWEWGLSNFKTGAVGLDHIFHP